MKILLLLIFFLFFIQQTFQQYPFPKLYDLILNEKFGEKVSSKDITDETFIELKTPYQKTNFSTSVFTQQKVSLQKGLNLRAAADLTFDPNWGAIDGIAIIIQNHPDGNKYIGEHELGLGVKNRSEKCAGLTIKAYQRYYNAYMIINFGDQEVYKESLDYYKNSQQQIYLKISILENDEAQLTFGIGDYYKYNRETSLTLHNFRKGLCLQEKEELSAFIGISSSSLSDQGSHIVALNLFKMVAMDCGCPDNYFPLNVIYKKDFTSLQANKDHSISIEEPKICDQCDDFEGQEREISLLMDYTWKIIGKKIISDNKTFIEFELPFISGNYEQNNKHLLTFLIDSISFGQKQFSVVSNSFLQEKWFVPFVKTDPNNDKSQLQVPLTGFSHNKTTYPPNIPPLDDQTKLALSQKQEKFYQVDVYSRPIIQGKEEFSLLELSNQRIKIDSIKNAVENSDSIVQVKEWIPTKEINIQTEKYVLKGQSYEYEIKHEDGSLIQLIKTNPEISLNILYGGACYGNYCTTFFCKKNDQDDSAPISELDKVCKEMDEDIFGKLSTILGIAEMGPDNKLGRLASKMSKIFLLNDLYNIGKVVMAQCPANDLECKTAKYIIVGKMLANQINVVGKINLISDAVNMLIEDGYYELSKLGEWIKSKFTGDPHITNLDGCRFDFQGQGDFVLLEEKMIGFAIHSRFLQHSSFKNVTTINSIAIRGFWGSPLVQFESLLNEKTPLIRVNGLIVKIEQQKPFEIPNLRIKVAQENYFIEFSNSIQLQVTNHGYGFLWTGFATIPAIFSGKLQGILGNGDSEDNQSDFQPGNNVQTGYEGIKSCKEVNAENIWKFGQSWRLTQKEDSILFYKKDKNPNSYFDANWKPISTEEIIKQAGEQKQKDARNQCRELSGEDFENCFFDLLLFQKEAKNVGVKVAYENSKEQPLEGKVYLIYKNVSEASAELEFGINNLEKLCPNGCNTKILSKKAEESQFNLNLQLQNTEQKISQKISGLDKNTLYTFQVEISDKSGSKLVSSNLVSLYTLKDTCVPFCAKTNACGDDGCGGQCDQKEKCSLECKFGVCQAREENKDKDKEKDKDQEKDKENDKDKDKEKDQEKDKDQNKDKDKNEQKNEQKNEKQDENNTLKIILISVSSIVLIIIIIFLIFFIRRRILKAKQQQLLEKFSDTTQSTDRSLNIN